MSSKPSSIEAAFHRAAADNPGLFGVDATPEAIDGLRDGAGNLPKNVFQLIRQNPGDGRGRGRPKGAGNKRNADVAKLIIHKYGDPLDGMGSLYAMPLDQLVELIRLVDPGKDGKTGDLAIKALNLQLAARKAVSEYVHSRKPVEANVNIKSDGTLVFPGGFGGGFDALDAQTREAAGLIQLALENGSISSADLAGMKLVEGQLVDAEWEPVDDAGDDEDAGA